MSGSPNKIEGSLSLAQLQAFLEELKALSAKPTLAQIQACAKRYGIDVSLMGAKTFRDNTFKAHLDRLAAGREKSAQILQAVRDGGAHPLDAVEEAASADLLDAYTSGAEVDVAEVVKIALQLRASIEQRKDRDRQDAELARKQKETAARLQLVEKQLALRGEQVAKLEREKADWEKKRADAKAALSKVARKGGISRESLKQIEEAAAIL